MKKIMSVCLTMVILFSMSVFATDTNLQPEVIVKTEVTNPFITIDGFRVRFEKPHIKKNKEIMIAYQDVKNISLYATYDDKTDTVFAYTNDDILEFKPGQSRIKINTKGVDSWINVEPAFVQGNTIYVPLITILQYADGEITYDELGDMIVELPKEKKITNFESGSIYEGFYSFGGTDRQGYGVYKWSTGEVYMGNWFNGSRNGQGKFIWPNGHVFSGYFVDGKKNGYGLFMNAAGDIIEKGMYVDGILQPINPLEVNVPLKQANDSLTTGLEDIPTVSYVDRWHNEEKYKNTDIVIMGTVKAVDIEGEELIIMIDENEGTYSLAYGQYVEGIREGDTVLILGEYAGVFDTETQDYGKVEAFLIEEYSVAPR